VLRYQLSEQDRERLGLPEWMEFDPTKLLMSEAEALEDTGYNTDEFLDDLAGYEVYDRQGNQVMVAELEEDGSPALDEDGHPRMRPKIRFRVRAHKAAVWMAARRAGCGLSFGEFDFDLSGMRTKLDTGKEPGSGQASPS
jgi:hypothetical protein